MNWSIKEFNDLALTELYRIIQGRMEVFAVEQGCAYQDLDDIDLVSKHVFAEEDGKLAAYCRITPRHTRFPEVSIGRVITTKAYRRKGHGITLMKLAARCVFEEMGEDIITISGQTYLQKFYEDLGYKTVSGLYYEDTLPHYKMQLTKENWRESLKKS